MKTNKKEKIIKVNREDINLVGLYLLDTSSYYYDIATEDAEVLYNTDKNEFSRLLKKAKEAAKLND